MPVTEEEIKQTKEYKDLISIGCRDLGTDTRSRRPELKINVEHPILGINSNGIMGNITIFETGYQRIFTTQPEKLSSAHGYTPDEQKKYVMNIHEWEHSLEKVFNYILKKIITSDIDDGGMGLSTGTSNHVLRFFNTKESKLHYLITYKPNSFFKWVNTLDSKTAEGIIDATQKPLIAMINAKPNQWVITLKELYKNPAVVRVVNKLNTGAKLNFLTDLELAGDLGELGF